MPTSNSLNHPASLIPSVCHDHDLLHLMHQPVSYDMIKFVASKAASVIEIGETTALPSPPLTPDSVDFPNREPWKEQSQTGNTSVPPLERFIYQVVRLSHVQVPTLLCVLVYLNRLREKLPKMAKGPYIHLNFTFQ